MSGSRKANFRYSIIPEWIIVHPQLTDCDIRVYTLLDRYGDQAFPSVITLAERLHKDERTIQRAIGRLTHHGAVRVEKRYGEDGRQTSNLYVLASDEPLRGVKNDTLPGVTDATPEGDKNATRTRTTRTREREPYGSLALASSVRMPNPIFDALVEACGYNYAKMTAADRKRAGVAAAALAKVDATPTEIALAASVWRTKFRDATMTPTGIASQYAQLLASSNGNVGVKYSPGMQAIQRAKARTATSGERSQP